MPKARIKTIERDKTTFDILVKKYRLKDAVLIRIKGAIRDHEFDEANLESQVQRDSRHCYVLKGLEKTSETDVETISEALSVMDTLYTSRKKLKGEAYSTVKDVNA